LVKNWIRQDSMMKALRRAKLGPMRISNLEVTKGRAVRICEHIVTRTAFILRNTADREIIAERPLPRRESSIVVAGYRNDSTDAYYL